MSRSASRSAGKVWRRSQLMFYPHSDENLGTTCTIQDNSLIQDMSELIDGSENIREIWVYKIPLFQWQSTALFFNHQFVILETRNWWWSIEKNDQQIVIQRSNKLSSVRDYLEQTKRKKPVTQLSYDKGRKSMKELIEFLYKTDELNKMYHWKDDNCKDFAKRIFDKFAKTKFHGTVLGCDPQSDESFTSYTIHDNSLIQDMSELIDGSENIEQIWVYKIPFFQWQLTALFLNHQFVVFETRNWWWSIEKNDQQIVIQRSKKLSSVRDYFNQTERKKPVTLQSYDKGRKSMKELKEFLYKTDELNRKYDWMDDDCKDFAKRIFDEFAETKFHGIVLGCN